MLLKPLARGGMGEVYLATAGGIEGAERPCVVKIIRREHAKDTSFLARFFDEARIQAQLQHPGVAQVLEASTDASGKPYVVLEHIEGRNLSEVRQRAAQLKIPLSWADAVAVAVCLTEALIHVHERTDAAGRALAIVHRDMSPQNVMVGYGGDVKLIDFGTARGENRRCQTVSGVVFAKPGYVAPEVANQNQPGPQADLYAVGVILWELAMGRRFLNGDPSEHLAQVAAGLRYPAPISSTNNVPLELDEVVNKLTAFELADRYPNAREAHADLVRVLGRAPSLADGERSVRGRIAHLMNRLYPSEPMRTRAEFARLLAEHRQSEQPNPFLPESPAPVASTELLPGTRYHVLKSLSQSEMSVVYEAVHVDLERKVALKVLPKERCENPHFEARFRREAKALAQLKDEGLVTLHDFGVSQDGRPYYAMELLEGKTLAEITQHQPISWRRAIEIGLGVCNTLETTHGHGLVHRDIKPSNIFVTSAGKTKVLDFGVAQAGDEELEEDTSNAVHVNGTPEYMAPEQIGKEEVDASADIYALATVIYELCTGQLPFEADSTIQLMDDKRRGRPQPTRRLRPHAGIPAALDGVLLKALDPLPAARYPTARRFREALESIVNRSKRKTLRRMLAAAVVLGATSAIAGATFELARPEIGGARLTPGPLVAEAPPNGGGRGNLAPAPMAHDAPKERGVSEDHARRAQLAAPEGDQDPSGAQAEADAEREAEELAAGTDPAASAARDAEATDGAIDLDATPEPAELSDEDATRLERAERLLHGDSGARLKALALYRELAEAYPNHPEVLAGWSRAAARSKWWGESLRAALRWASRDPGIEAQLHLARTQRLIGQRFGAIQTLERVLAKAPEHREATAMLARYRKH